MSTIFSKTTMKFLCCMCNRMSEKSCMVVLPKSEEMLDQWIKQYSLKLKYSSKGGDQFVCKLHLDEYKMPGLISSDLYFENPSTSTEYLQDVKQEDIVEEDAYGQGYSLVEPKEEAVDYADVAFEYEDNSYANYEDENNYQQRDSYQIECAPSTSKPNQNSYPRFRNLFPPPPKPSVDFADLPLYYPELSDCEVMSFCVKTSSNLSGETAFECGMCPEQYFNSTDTRPVRMHFQFKHSVLIRNYLQTGEADSAPKKYAAIPEKTKMQADRELCTFLIRNGLPLKTVQDRNLEMLCFNANSSYSLPSVDILCKYMEEFASLKTNSKIQPDNGPVTVTFDTTSFNNRNFLAFSVHYLQKSRRKTSIFLREFEVTHPVISSIMSTIKSTIEESIVSGRRLPITTIVTGKAEFEEPLEATSSFKQVMVCFSENLNKFAESLIRHPDFAAPLQRLRHFINQFPVNRHIWSRFKSFIIRKRTYGEYPEIDSGHWITTVDFVTKCLHMHRLFSDFVSQNSVPVKYITGHDNIDIVYLHNLLNHCKSVLKTLLNSNTTIADVIPAIMELQSQLNISTSNQSVIDSVNMLFNRLLLPFVQHSDPHRFALFLHPRRHWDPLLPAFEWEEIRRELSHALSLRDSMSAKSFNERLKMNYQHGSAVDKELVAFSTYINNVSGIETDIMDFWARQSTRFPRLQKLAKELFQIPVFSIDASFYLGEYGLITHSFQEMESSKQKTLLQASSHLVDFRAKGDIMCKPICVKRKRENNSAEDMWYTAIDPKGLLAGQEPAEPKSRMPVSAAALKSNKIFLAMNTPPIPPTRPKMYVPPQRPSFKEEMTRMGRPVMHQKYQTPSTSSPYARPMIKRRPLPPPVKMRQPIPEWMEPKMEPGHITRGPAMEPESSLTEPKMEAEPSLMEEVVKQEEESVSTPPAKKYYAVRTMPGSGQKVVRIVNGKMLQVVRPRVPPPSSYIANVVPSAASKKVYFVRTKTGATHQIHKPPIL
ncbi:hypothetical protein L3Y34_008578 [Caenorhabditis briggsae]|uniref:HAT C-terminal dimerisation domain-containing protein n=2 Tax=Caenorhabditis briggsae TaxID=6238 RepID=A0AAE9A9Z9_CAEBR|nr:hypothetical protein L3Y34_008578 [Caenorhabditis briggsae]